MPAPQLRLAAVAALGLFTRTLAAQGWVAQPNGSWALAHTLLPAGAFACGTAGFRAPDACTTTANSVTLRNGASTFTVRFDAFAAQLVTAGNRSTAPIMLGTITTRVKGGPFTLPAVASPGAALFTFALDLRMTAPQVQTGRPGPVFGFSSLPGTFLRNDAGGALWSVFTTPEPRPLGYGMLVYDSFVLGDLAFSNASIDVTARAVLVPEPAAPALLVGGLVVLGGLERRRRLGTR